MVTKSRNTISRNGTNGVHPEVTAEEITPETAADSLGLNTKNRRLKDKQVQRLAGVIRRGEWQPYNGETIKYAKNGRLIDGQHRLAAVVMADMPIKTLVARNIDEEAFRTIDSGKVRRASDTLYLLGEEREAALASTLNALFRWNQYKRFNYGEGATTTELLEVLEQNPGIRTSLLVGIDVHKKVSGASTSLIACLHYVFSALSSEDADEFFNKLRDGTDLKATDAIYHLRERLTGPRATTGNGFRYQDEVGAFTIKAWNAYRRGVPMQRLTYRPGTDAYPEPI